MRRLLGPFVLIILAIGLYYFFTRPILAEVRALHDEQASFDQALNNAKELQAVRDALRDRYNSISRVNLQKLDRLLPDSIDNVRLIIDIENIARRHGLAPRSVAIKESEARPGTAADDGRPYHSVVLAFSVTGTYETFKRFLADLERSLRLVDVVGISFSAAEDPVYTYQVSLRTYWLK
ncbi:MAG: type 4a pilus biogenesis protein PilO [Candidatus Vogelbacteria bacterium]|nr:type 4a pilus biogenesis protein PilO [Candidatus Vogelbacteria bacterium]